MALSWGNDCALVPGDAAREFTCLSPEHVARIDARDKLDQQDAAAEARVAARRERAAARAAPQHERAVASAESAARRQARGDAVLMRRRLNIGSRLAAE